MGDALMFLEDRYGILVLSLCWSMKLHSARVWVLSGIILKLTGQPPQPSPHVSLIRSAIPFCLALKPYEQ